MIYFKRYLWGSSATFGTGEIIAFEDFVAEARLDLVA